MFLNHIIVIMIVDSHLASDHEAWTNMCKDLWLLLPWGWLYWSPNTDQ